MLFVSGLPFIYYLGFELGKKWQRVALWAVIPFGWHAIFLTGSRGGLLGLVVVVIAVLLFARRKILVIPMMVLFVIFYQWQAGDTMKSRSETIADYEGESSAEGRISAWKAGLGMVVQHPLLGVGLGSFMSAMPQFSDDKPRVAHNTLVQFAAESGIFAGVAYLMSIWLFCRNFSWIQSWSRLHNTSPDVGRVVLYNQASTASFAGLVVCSMFLSLNTYEIFFVLILFNNCLLQFCRRKEFEHTNTGHVV
jgi:O-antigen ligase